jgi:hypothetical protein
MEGRRKGRRGKKSKNQSIEMDLLRSTINYPTT